MTMDKSWKDMPLGPSEQDYERWAKESAARIGRRMDEAIKKAATASPMTIEIKQVDREAAADACEMLYSAAKLTAMREGRCDNHRVIQALATQRSTYEARIAELEAERDALRRALPANIGRLHLGEHLSGNERLCHWGHVVPNGHPLYWPQAISQYDDSDPCCLEHAIAQSENEQGYGASAETDLWKDRATAAEARLAEAVRSLKAVISIPAVRQILGSNHTSGCDCPLCGAARFIQETERG